MGPKCANLTLVIWWKNRIIFLGLGSSNIGFCGLPTYIDNKNYISFFCYQVWCDPELVLAGAVPHVHRGHVTFSTVLYRQVPIRVANKNKNNSYPYPIFGLLGSEARNWNWPSCFIFIFNQYYGSVSVFRSSVNPDPYFKYGSGSTHLNTVPV